MDILRFKELKEKRNIQVVKIGSAFAVVKKKYDAETGEPLNDEIEAFDIGQIEQQKEAIEKQLKGIEEFLAECERLKQ